MCNEINMIDNYLRKHTGCADRTRQRRRAPVGRADGRIRRGAWARADLIFKFSDGGEGLFDRLAQRVRRSCNSPALKVSRLGSYA